MPGLVYQSLRKEFPIIREKPDGFQFGGFGMPTLTPVSGTTQFVTERNDKLIQLSSSIFTANVVQDYKGWEEFFPVIESALNIFLQNVEEPAIARAGLRYINKIDVEQFTLANLKKCFNLAVSLPDGLKYDSNSLQLLMELPIVAQKEFVSISLATLLPHENYKAPVMLDIGCFLNNPAPEADTNEDILSWLQRSAHPRLREVFELSLTDHCKSKF